MQRRQGSFAEGVPAEDQTRNVSLTALPAVPSDRRSIEAAVRQRAPASNPQQVDEPPPVGCARASSIPGNKHAPRQVAGKGDGLAAEYARPSSSSSVG